MSKQKVDFMGKREPRNERHRMVDVIPLKAPYVVNLNPCGSCNFHCAFCPSTAQNLHPRYQKHVKDTRAAMPMDLFYRIADGFLELDEQVKVIYLTLTGEPLLHPHITEMVDYLKRKHVCREVRIITNGAKLNPKLNQSLIDAGLDVLKVSVEALDEDGYQRFCGAKIDYDKFLENIADFHARCKDTNTQIVAKILTIALQDKAQFEHFYELYEPITDYQEVRNVEQCWPGFEYDETIDGEHVVIPESEIGYKGICPAPFSELGINTDGSVGLCRLDWAGELFLGNAYEMSIREIWESDRRRELMLRHLKGKSEVPDFCQMCTRSFFGDEITEEDAKVILARMEGA